MRVIVTFLLLWNTLAWCQTVGYNVLDEKLVTKHIQGRWYSLSENRKYIVEHNITYETKDNWFSWKVENVISTTPLVELSISDSTAMLHWVEITGGVGYYRELIFLSKERMILLDNNGRRKVYTRKRRALKPKR